MPRKTAAPRAADPETRASRQPRKTGAAGRSASQDASQDAGKARGATIHPLTPPPDGDIFANEEALTAAIERMAGIGLNSTDIAYLTGVNRTTLDTRYLEVQRRGRAKANMKVANTMFQIATDKEHPKCATMGIFYSKVHMGWSDAPEAGGETLPARVQAGPDPITDEQVAGRFEGLMTSLRNA